MDSTRLQKDLAGLDFDPRLMHAAPMGNVWLCEYRHHLTHTIHLLTYRQLRTISLLLVNILSTFVSHPNSIILYSVSLFKLCAQNNDDIHTNI